MNEPVNQNKLSNEAELARQAKTDDQAFSVLYNFYFQKIYSYVIKRVGNQEIAEDIVSETFLKTFKNIDKYEHQGYTFGAWVYKIATNNMIDYYRKTGRQKTVDIEAIAEPVSDRPSPEKYAEKSEDQRMVLGIIAKMNVKDQQVLNLKFFAEMSNIEISETLGITANNAGVIVYRALKKFQKLYDKHYG